MSDNDRDSMGTDETRRCFFKATAGLGAAAFVGIGLNSQLEAKEKTKSNNANLDPGRAARNCLMFSGVSSQFGTVFRDILLHENEHVVFLAQALGASARPKPTFQGLQQSNVKNFVNLSRTFENTGVGAYLNAAPYINSQEYLAAAGSIALVEGRHAGFLNVATMNPITQNNADFEMPLPPATVAAAVAPFIKSLNGGPPLTYALTRSASNDIQILNFALALEYLEAEFYNLNVPIFF